MRIFITNILPKNISIKYKTSNAANNFSWNLIDGGIFDKSYSIPPSFIKDKIRSAEKLQIIQSSIRRFNILSKFSPIIEQVKLYRFIPKKSSIWFYNVTSLNFLLIVLLKLFKRKSKVYIIVLDYSPTHKYISFSKLFLWLINKSDGLIKLSQNNLFSVENNLVLPGIVPNIFSKKDRISKVNYDFLISGELSEHISMLPMLLEAFSKLPNMRLHITGVCPSNINIDLYTKKFPNIIYYGLVSYNKYISILESTTFCLSTRNPKYEENQYNFPSKIIESLLYNRIVISTIEYPQLGNIKYFIVSPNLDFFIKDIEYIYSKSDNEIMSFANQSNIVEEKFSVKVWNDSMSIIENKK